MCKNPTNLWRREGETSDCITSSNEGVVDTSDVLPGQASGEQSDWIATFPWDEDNCRWVLGKGNHG